MAEVMPLPQLKQRVEKDLENQLALWRSVPEMADEWPEWDEYSRDDFRLQWPIERESMTRLRTAAAAGLLGERQQRDWVELQQLVETHRSVMEWMLEGRI